MNVEEARAIARDIQNRYDAQLKALDSAKEVELLELRRSCPHAWKWHQVAGNGKFCTICHLVDYTDD